MNIGDKAFRIVEFVCNLCPVIPLQKRSQKDMGNDESRVGAGAEWRWAGMLASPRPLVTPANTPIYANHVGGNNEHMVMHRIGIFGSTGATRQGELLPWVLSQARRKRSTLPTYRT